MARSVITKHFRWVFATVKHPRSIFGLTEYVSEIERNTTWLADDYTSEQDALEDMLRWADADEYLEEEYVLQEFYRVIKLPH